MTSKHPQTNICEPIQWEAHACLPLLPGQDMSGQGIYRNAGFHHVSVNVGMDMTPFPDVIRVLAGFRHWLGQNEDEYLLAGTVADIQRARDQCKSAVSFDLEGSNMLQQDVAMVGLFARLGVRQMLLAYNRDNSCAGGCHGAGGGLTPLGREVVSEINRSGVVMDCSHASKRSSLEIMEFSQNPVIFSHTNVKAIHDHPRTIDDEQILACAAQGGVIGLTGLGIFLGDPTLRSPPTSGKSITWPSESGSGTSASVSTPNCSPIIETCPRAWTRMIGGQSSITDR
jgi:membrane dipeptidase